MRGTLWTLRPRPEPPTIEHIDGPPKLGKLHEAVGGYLGLVPHFDTIELKDAEELGYLDPVVLACVAFCDEDGIRKELPFNYHATALWELALHRHKLSLQTPDGWRDILRGPVVVVIGDHAFMDAL